MSMLAASAAIWEEIMRALTNLGIKGSFTSSFLELANSRTSSDLEDFVKPMELNFPHL